MDLDLEVSQPRLVQEAYFWTSLFAVVALPARPELPIVFITGTKVGRRCHGVNMARQSKAVASLGCGSPQTGRT
jgi:hypothetical protein